MDGNFLNGRCHIVVLNGHVLSETDVNASDPDEVRIIRDNLAKESNPDSIFVCKILFLSVCLQS